MKASITELSFFSANVCIQYYKISSKHFCHYIPQILIDCFQSHLVSKCVWISVEILLLFRVCYLISKYFGIFILLLTFSSIMVREHTLYDIFTLLNLLRLVLWPRMWYVLLNVPCELEECLWCCCWMKYFINVSLVQFMYFAMQILPDFLPASKELNSLACNSGFTCFFLQF